MGERSPHNDVNAKGAFIGLGAASTKGQMSRAVMEGVAFALKDCMDIAVSQGIDVRKTRICGGGAKSALWKQIMADVLEIPVESLVTEQGPAYGAAILAMVGAGEYSDVITAAEALVKAKETVYPTEDTDYYRNKYKNFRALYPAMKEIFASM
jgi:xylulokinase